MAILPNGRYCDHVSQRKPGAPETFCRRKAHHTIRGKSGGPLDYCNKHISAALKEYPQGLNLPTTTKRGYNHVTFSKHS